MKPTTIEQENSFMKYRINHDEINRQSLHDWQVKCLAMKIIGDQPNADT